MALGRGLNNSQYRNSGIKWYSCKLIVRVKIYYVFPGMLFVFEKRLKEIFEDRINLYSLRLLVAFNAELFKSIYTLVFGC